MNTPQITKKIVGVFESRQSPGNFLQGILAKGEKYLVERHGEPVVVPLTVYERWKQNRTTFFDALRRSQKQSTLSEEPANRLACEATQVVRTGDKYKGRA